MTKLELVQAISERTGIRQDEVKTVLDTCLDVTKETMAKKEDIFLRGFGTFVVKRRAAKKARIISTGESIMIPERDVPTFKPSKDFLELL